MLADLERVLPVLWFRCSIQIQISQRIFDADRSACWTSFHLILNGYRNSKGWYI